MIRRKRSSQYEQPELNITSFMNLMIVLVPVLLISMVFSQTTVLDLKLPSSAVQGNTEKAKLNLEVVVRKDRLIVADSKRGVIKTIKQKKIDIEGEPHKVHNYELLSHVLQQIKSTLKYKKKDITLLLERDTNYKTIVEVMDTVRSYSAVVAASVVEAELFPDISIGDAPRR